MPFKAGRLFDETLDKFIKDVTVERFFFHEVGSKIPFIMVFCSFKLQCMGSIGGLKGYSSELFPLTSFFPQTNQNLLKDDQICRLPCTSSWSRCSCSSTSRGQVQRILFKPVHGNKTQEGYLT